MNIDDLVWMSEINLAEPYSCSKLHLAWALVYDARFWKPFPLSSYSDSLRPSLAMG